MTRRISRRAVLKHGLLAATAAGLGPRFLFRPAGSTEGARRVLVCVFQRGGVDGLNMIVPHAEPRYFELRPGIAVPAPGSGEGAALDLDGRFALHPAMGSLLPAWQTGELALVHACGSTAPTRSHFDAQDNMERGAVDDASVADGWVNRHLQHTGDGSEAVFRAVAMTSREPLALTGPADTLTAPSLAGLRLGGTPRAESLRDAVERMYLPRDDRLGDVARSALDAVDMAGELSGSQSEVEYPAGGFAADLRDVARLIRADVGLEVAFVEVGGWDTHEGEAGRLAAGLRNLSDGLTAFRADLGERMADVCVVTMSEFGRTARENGSGGTDHGRATAMMVLGGTVNGGRVYGDWPGLDDASLEDGRDLAVKTDFRTLFAELVERHLGNPRVDLVFPGLAYSESTRLGVIV
jgi:uncharacterized protein (DUF1501 family)